LTITGGFASYGGGIYSTNSDFLLDQVLITQNSANRDGGAVALVNSNLELEHATLTNNSVPDLYSESSHVKISNTIIWPARWLGIKLVYNKDTEGDSVVIRHSAIRGGLGWIAKDDRVNLTWADSNLDASPLFCHWDEGNYWLSAGSPCLGAGADGTNIGVFGIGCDIPIAIQPSPDATIVSFELHQNYPNPFNPSTTIRYELPEGAMVRLMVYDLQGREITQLVEGNQQIGYHEAVWDGCGRYGRQLPSGIYIARLVTPEYNKSIKMVLLK
jgi:hypothetical protein